ncbi:MAG: endolytic transglycosylase MltG [Treponema sp.]|nr:endolytic transglycosylase MltG [Treponema sp.]
MKKKLIIIPVVLLLLAGIISGGFVYLKFLLSPVSENDVAESVRIEIPSGMSVSGAASLLYSKGLIRNEKLFYYIARYPVIKKYLFEEGYNDNFVLRSGIYYVKPSMNIAQIQTLLSSGQQEYIKVSIPEGLTISKIAAELEEKRICSAADFIDVCKNESFTASSRIKGLTCEGFLFPDTYFLTAGMSAEAVAKIMIDNFFVKIKEIPSLAQLNDADLYQTVILASIVEREYRVEVEAPLIASVFKNRLRRNIGLYSCATVEYILTEIEGRPHPERILIEDTKIDNPYNTYKWAGLPPGPISNPGLVALRASSETPKTDYYFFQIVDAAAGRHVFTTNFEEHIQNHSLYTKKSGR